MQKHKKNNSDPTVSCPKNAIFGFWRRRGGLENVDEKKNFFLLFAHQDLMVINKKTYSASSSNEWTYREEEKNEIKEERGGN